MWESLTGLLRSCPSRGRFKGSARCLYILAKKGEEEVEEEEGEEEGKEAEEFGTKEVREI